MVNDFGGIGRGRQNDSESSSRESSPQPSGRKRSFSPPSDDDTVLPPMACDDTPPPPDRPLIRQAVAFQETPKADGIVTYRATPSKPKTNSAFLPGQEVAPNTKERVKRAPKTRRGDEYASQTGRFRIQTYDPTPSAEPAISHGNGPYNALFRGATPNVSSSADAGTSRQSVNKNKSSGSIKRPGALNAKAPSSRRQDFAAPIPNNTTRTSTSFSPTPEITFTELYTTSPTALQADRDVRSSSSTASSYYRRDYEKDTTISSSLETSKHINERSENSMHTMHSSNQSVNSESKMEQDSNSGKRQKKIPLRMVTILINDTRSEIEDLQLAEVRIALRLADDPSCGYWADAKELSQCLQASPSRIDGPAKVFTMRGKYRQFFLRISADNRDEFDSANLNITPERTLEIVVEWLAPRGTRTHGSQEDKFRSRSRFPTRPYGTDLEYDNDIRGRGYEGVRSPSNANVNAHTRKHRLSPSSSDYDYSSSRESFKKRRAASSSTARSVTHDASSRSSPVAAASRNLTEDFDDDIIIDDECDHHEDSQHTSLYVMDRGYESPSPDDGPEEVHKAISNAVASMVGKHPIWDEFFQATAGRRVDSYLKQYECLEKMMDKFVGQLAPFHSSKHAIEKGHIVEALSIEEGDKYISNCTETLKLVKLYGKNGRRCEDAKVVEMMNDKSEPELHANPIKRFLRLLREVDASWKKEHGGELCDSDSD
ncbi:hypothetical protein BDQ17DRAFT_1343859 [Cyathus striatus]|nr:hypothetical protein BDQ17DRAFT_1343859 [Cyathus striatus]